LLDSTEADFFRILQHKRADFAHKRKYRNQYVANYEKENKMQRKAKIGCVIKIYSVFTKNI
jgi:uncharacterized membrane protein YbaN (DUF454 family)